jgi:hypothetical protein
MQEQWPSSKMAMPNTELDWWEAWTKEKEKTRWRSADHTLY